MMIIKAYPLQDGPTEKIHIFEDCTDVVIDTNIHPSNYIGLGPTTEPGQPMSIIDLEPTQALSNQSTGVSAHPERYLGHAFVDFTRHGVRQRLLVSNRAYVCTDEGKTIQKVSVR